MGTESGRLEGTVTVIILLLLLLVTVAVIGIGIGIIFVFVTSANDWDPEIRKRLAPLGRSLWKNLPVFRL